MRIFTFVHETSILNIMRIILLILLTFISTINITADINERKLHFKIIDNLSGLPSNEIKRIHQDKEGFLWFASNNGLIRHDGYEFKLYNNSINNPDLLPSNMITAINDSEKYLWIGTDRGLCYLDKQTQKIHTIYTQSLQQTTIYQIECEKEKIWLATNKGLFLGNIAPDSIEIEKFKIIDGKENINVKSILIDSKGQLWVGVDKNGLFRYDNLKKEFIKYPSGKVSNFAHLIYEDKFGNIWIGTWGEGLVLVKNSNDPQKTMYTYFKHNKNHAGSIGSDIIYAIKQDSISGDLWIGHQQGLSILKYDNTDYRFINFSPEKSNSNLSNNEVSGILQDKNGNMWLGTIGGGINKTNLNSRKFKYIQLPTELTNKTKTKNITAINSDNDKNLWVGLKNNGLIIFNPEKNRDRVIQINNRIPIHANIRCILPVDNGNKMLVGTDEYGLYVFDNVSKEHKCLNFNNKNSDIVYNNNILEIFEDQSGHIWLGTGNGISIIDKNINVIAKETFSDSINKRNPIISIAEQPNGTIWLGVRNKGIIRCNFTDSKIKYKRYISEKNTLSNNNITSIFIDSKDRVLVGSKSFGLSIYNKQSDHFESVNQKYNIPSSDIFNIFEDEKHNIWMCNNNGLIKIDDKNAQTEIYNAVEFPWNNVFTPECNIHQYKKNVFILGGMYGLNYINSADIQANTNIPQFSITDIAVDYKSIFTTNNTSGYEYNNNRLILEKKNNNFSAQFAALNYTSPEKIQYAFRLLGFEDQWNYISSKQRNANYTNLDKGEYILQIKYSNENGIWIDKPVELHIKVLPGIYETWYAFLLYIILIAAIGYIIYKVSKNRMMLNNQLHLAEIEKKSNEELTKSKLRFFTNISHELLTPLTIIGCSAEEIKAEDSFQKENINNIQHNVNKLIELIRQVLDFNKAENGKLKLKVSEGNLSEILRSICENDFNIVAKQRNISLTYTINQTIRGWFDADKIDKIMNNLLSNAIKYNYDNSYVHVSLKEDYDEDKRYAIINVKDGGVGMEPEVLKHIFERYFENDYRETKKISNGIGMALTKSLVELHKGEISIDSIPGKGTNVTITIPINEFSYSKEEKNQAFSINENSDETEVDENHIENNIRILFAEDNDELRNMVHRTLSKYYVVDAVENGEKAIEQLSKAVYNIVITDIMMPVMDGNELCAYIKSNLEYSHIPVILLTAKTAEEDKIIAYENGADAFISKPFKMQLLLSRINNLLKGRELLINNYKTSDDSVQLTSITYTSIDEEFIKKAIKFVEENMSNEDLTFDMLVSEMNVSKSTLYRKIKSLTGMTTSDFIKDIRLKAACKIMKEKPVNITEVAYLVGFGQPKYFTYCFKKKFGILPSEYIAKFSNNAEIRSKN